MAVHVNPISSRYDLPKDEKLVEYSNGTGLGGLIHFYEDEKGHLIVDLYRHNEGVLIRVRQAS